MADQILLSLAVEHRPLATLHPDPRNPRQHSHRQIKQIASSIESFGFNVPVLIDANGKILAGHGRVLAAKRLGWQAVPVIRLEHLTTAQASAFAIADNRLTEIATWDDRLLGEVFNDLAALHLDFSLEDTGFSMAEIDLRIEGLSGGSRAKPDAADDFSEMVDAAPVTQAGDLWLLDGHRVLCADALDRAAYQTLMGANRANLVFTDPPYNVRIDGHATGNGAVRHREFAMAAGEMTELQFTQFLITVLALMVQHSTAGSLHYICMDWRHQLELLTAGRQAYAELKNLCVWVKSSAGMGTFYRSRHELVFVFKNGIAPHRNNIELGRFGRDRSNVWCYAGANGFGRQSEEGNLLKLHPTPKPVSMIADAILDSSARGAIVLDSFLGSGSTLIAAQRVGRVCYGIEIDPRYVDTVVRRWQHFSGGVAIHAGTGERSDARADGSRTVVGATSQVGGSPTEAAHA